MMNPALRLASIAIGFCVYAGHSWLGWVSVVLLSPGADRARGSALFAFRFGVFRWRKSQPRCARGPRQPLVIPVFMVIGLVNAYNAEEDLLRAHFGYEHIAYSS